MNVQHQHQRPRFSRFGPEAIPLETTACKGFEILLKRLEKGERPPRDFLKRIDRIVQRLPSDADFRLVKREVRRSRLPTEGEYDAIANLVFVRVSPLAPPSLLFRGKGEKLTREALLEWHAFIAFNQFQERRRAGQ